MVKNRYKSLFHFESKRYDQKMTKEKVVEQEILATMIFKLKKNIEEGEKLTQNFGNKENISTEKNDS